MEKVSPQKKTSNSPKQPRNRAKGPNSEITLHEGLEQFKYASKVEGKAEKTLEQYSYVL